MESNANSKRRRAGRYKIEAQRRINALIEKLVNLSKLLMEGNEREHGTINSSV
jgi:hypothetical protein